MYPGAIAKSHPDKIAYQMAASGETVSYATLDARSNQCAQLLYELGLRPGDAIALCMENHPRFLEIAWAAQRSGLYWTAISSRLTAAEVAYIVNDCQAKVMFTSSAKGDIAAELVEQTPLAEHRFMLTQTQDGYESYEDAVANQSQDPLEKEFEGSDMLYSSGTTGRPKGVRIPLSGNPAGQPPALLMLVKGLYQASEEAVYLSPAPLYHAAPLRFTMAFQRLGATTIIMEQFDPLESLRLIEQHRITHSQWVPTMFVRMLKQPEAERKHFDLSSLRVAIHAAAPCPIPVKEAMIDWWGPVLYEYYAGTEGNGFVAINSEEWLAHKGSVGRPLLGEIHILDDDGNPLPNGEVGGIFFQNGATFEYHNDPEKTAASRSKTGASTLGDIGYVDDDGFLYLTDRKANMIISGGVNIYPQEAENVLITHPKVADVAVFGVPNEEFGEEVKGVVELLPGEQASPELADELMAYCQASLSKIKCPRSIDFSAELPRHPTGKLYKRLIKDRYWGERNSRII